MRVFVYVTKLHSNRQIACLLAWLLVGVVRAQGGGGGGNSGKCEGDELDCLRQNIPG